MKAAEKGFLAAMINLTMKYEAGEGVERDVVAAFAWAKDAKKKSSKLLESQELSAKKRKSTKDIYDYAVQYMRQVRSYYGHIEGEARDYKERVAAERSKAKAKAKAEKIASDAKAKVAAGSNAKDGAALWKQGKKKEALELWKTLAEGGGDDAAAANNYLGRIYMSNVPELGISQDNWKKRPKYLELSRKYLQKSFDMGYLGAASGLYNLHSGQNDSVESARVACQAIRMHREKGNQKAIENWNKADDEQNGAWICSEYFADFSGGHEQDIVIAYVRENAEKSGMISKDLDGNVTTKLDGLNICYGFSEQFGDSGAKEFYARKLEEKGVSRTKISYSSISPAITGLRDKCDGFIGFRNDLSHVVESLYPMGSSNVGGLGRYLARDNKHLDFIVFMTFEEIQNSQKVARTKAKEKVDDYAALLADVESGTRVGLGFLHVNAPADERSRKICHIRPEDRGTLSVHFRNNLDDYAVFSEFKVSTITFFDDLNEAFSEIKKRACDVFVGNSQSLTKLKGGLERDGYKVTITADWITEAALETSRIEAEKIAEQERREEERRVAVEEAARAKEAACQASTECMAQREAERKRKAEARRVAEATETAKYPYVAIFSCRSSSGGNFPLITCLDEGDLKIRSNGSARIYSVQDLISARSELKVRLTDSFEVRAQANESEYMVLSLVIENRQGRVTYQDEATRFGIISVRN